MVYCLPFYMNIPSSFRWSCSSVLHLLSSFKLCLGRRQITFPLNNAFIYIMIIKPKCFLECSTTHTRSSSSSSNLHYFFFPMFSLIHQEQLSLLHIFLLHSSFFFAPLLSQQPVPWRSSLEKMHIFMQHINPVLFFCVFSCIVVKTQHRNAIIIFIAVRVCTLQKRDRPTWKTTHSHQQSRIFKSNHLDKRRAVFSRFGPYFSFSIPDDIFRWLLWCWSSHRSKFNRGIRSDGNHYYLTCAHFSAV